MLQLLHFLRLRTRPNKINSYFDKFLAFFAGILLPLGFAPFHYSGLVFISLALLYRQVRIARTPTQAFIIGFLFGIGFFGIGISWVEVSIHIYGHLNTLLSVILTGAFITYLAFFIGLMAFLYHYLAKNSSKIVACLLFSSLWCIAEYLRSTLFTGCPWLLIGFSQIDTPLKYLLPIFGLFGTAFITCLTATSLLMGIQSKNTTTIKHHISWISCFVILLLSPMLLQNINWTKISSKPLSVGIIQANLSMRDKWEEAIFWDLLKYYRQRINKMILKDQLIVLPESAIPIPAHYINDILDSIDQQAKQAGSAILLGIPKPTNDSETYFYNTMTALGSANGTYNKQHLVPFGEFIPNSLNKLFNYLSIPIETLKPGALNQPLVNVHNHQIATLICYELAYPELLRHQLPNAEWIVSISDDGWFGHSFAMYQQLQMAQTLSMQTSRYQVIANNTGLSSVINNTGIIIASLPAMQSGILETMLQPVTGSTFWVRYGDWPILLSLIIFCFACALHRLRYRTNKFNTPVYSLDLLHNR